MNTSEIRNKILSSKSPNWFKSVEVTINYPKIDFSIDLKGYSSIYKFLLRQITGWEKYENLPPELAQSLNHFTNLKSQLELFINSYGEHTEETLTAQWRRQVANIQANGNFLTFDHPLALFLIEIHSELPGSYKGAYNFLFGPSFNANNKDELTGALMAYEFQLKEDTGLVNRVKQEKRSISNLRSELVQQLTEAESQLTEHLTSANLEYFEHIKKLDELKEDRELIFNEWWNKSKQNFKDFDATSRAKIADLENTYKDLLRLKEPAEYWKKRAVDLNKEGWLAIKGLSGLVVFSCITLYFLLWLTPDGMLLSFINGQASAIKWSIVYVTFISFLAYGIRALNKVAFSSFHLARDAQEKEQLTYVYLSLIKDSAIDNEDKTLILQSLFSRADTGLIKGDSGPTMPSDFSSKIFGGGAS